MKTTFKLLLLCVVICSCSSAEKKLHKAIEKTLVIYEKQILYEMDSTLTVDSIRLLDVDTFTKKDQVVIFIGQTVDSANLFLALGKNYQKRLDLDLSLARSYSALRMWSLYTEAKNDLDDDLETAKMYLDLGDKYRSIGDSLVKAHSENTIDSTTFMFYKVLFKVCYSDKSLVQTCHDSMELLQTSDFRIKKRSDLSMVF
ncbi:MAG TPA: hypothetical protein VFG10_18905 [Saprospiraceae bacterium]|nr:hypothetical protein [Saprospiraceae bacterium]